MSTLSWEPSASLEYLRKRAIFIQRLRAFFVARDYLEVETPCLAQYGSTDLYLENIEAAFRGKRYYLQTSPEYHMKRLLAAGSGPIFQLARAFRDDELGRWHNPEFTLLEWYQLDIDHHALMDEMEALLQELLACPPLLRKTYREVFLALCDLDPFNASVAQLRACLKTFNLEGVFSPDESDRDLYLFLLMSEVIEPALAKEVAPIALYDFPASQAALACSKNGKAERFEIYFKGIELANGFHELRDHQLQAARFEEDLRRRAEKNLSFRDKDPYLLGALEQGLPHCSGVALGIDRLLALAFQTKGISEVMAFAFDRA